MTYRPTVPTSRPWFEAKLRKGAIASVAAWSGSLDRTTHATGSGATVTQLSQCLAALIADLQTRGIITTH